MGGTECSGERRGGGEGQRESDHEEEAEEEGGVRKEEGGRDQLLPDGFPTKQVRLHINRDCVAFTLLLTLKPQSWGNTAGCADKLPLNCIHHAN